MLCPVCLIDRVSVDDIIMIQEGGYCSTCADMEHDFDNYISEQEAREDGLRIIGEDDLYA